MVLQAQLRTEGHAVQYHLSCLTDAESVEVKTVFTVASMRS